MAKCLQTTWRTTSTYSVSGRSSRTLERAMWPSSAEELVAAQRALAAVDPPPWRPAAGPLAIGACAVCFPRGGTGPGAAGDEACAAAAVMRARRALATAVESGRAGAAYAPGLLALREGRLLEAAVRGLS